MKNNKLFFIALYFALFASSSVFAAPVNINVTGNVVASPCVFDPSASTLNIPFGDIPANTLFMPGSSTQWIPFNLVLKDCPSGTTTAKVTFSGTPEISNPDSMYQNAGTADNVAVELQGEGGNLFGNGKSYSGVVLSDRGYTFNLRTRIYSLGSAREGTVSATIQATFTYN